jgi:selenocysteine-specific elongation factor
MASVSLYGYDRVRSDDARLARLKLDHPVVLVPGDRFVLRQPAPVATIGGGRVLDCHPHARQRKAATRAWLEQLKDASIPEQLVLRVKRQGAAGISAVALAREAGCTQEIVRRRLEPAIQAQDIILTSGIQFVSRDGLKAATNQVLTLLDRMVQKPGITSIKSSELRSQTLLAPAVFDFVIADLVREGKLQTQDEMVSLVSASASLSGDSEQLAAIAQAYRDAGLAAPLVPELAQRFQLKEAEMRRLVTLLQRQKAIVRMGSDDLFMHVSALDGLASRMESQRGKLIDVASFKQLTGLSRKYAIPLLEYLDRARITRKQGDQRLVV